MRRGVALRRRRRLRTAVVQAVGVLAAAGLGLLVPGLSVGATVESPRVIELLVAVGASFVPVIAIIYSLLFLVLQFRSAAFTPRLNLFRDSPIVWRAFSFFTGVMVFCFATAFAIGKAPRTTLLVPIIVVVLVLVAIAVFCALQASAFRSIQLASTWWRSRAAAARSSTTPTPINDGGSGGVRPAVRGRRRGAVAGARRDATGHRLPLRRTRGRHHRALRAAGAGDPRGRSHRARPRRSGGSRARAAQATTTT
jgi:hypothetical protein